MKLFTAIVLVGLVLFYFVVQTFKVELFSWEVFAHTMYYYWSGFIVLGGWYYYKTEKHLKPFLILVLGIIFLDDLYDLLRGVDSVTIVMLIYNAYLLLWGALSGFAFIAYWKRHLPQDD